MSSIKVVLKDWLAEWSKYDIECEGKVREFIRQHNELVKEINYAYERQDADYIINLLNNFLSEKGLVIRTCNSCDKKNLICVNDIFEGLVCETCNELLLKPRKEQIDKKKKEKVDNTEDEEKEYYLFPRDFLSSDPKAGRKCLYCNNQVSSLTNAITCYSCRNVTFNVYDKSYFDNDY